MAKKKAGPRKRFLGTRVEDYPETMSLYERESLAAEAKLAQTRKEKDKKQKDRSVST